MKISRYPEEQPVLTLTVLLLLFALVITAGLTIFLIPLVVLVFVFIAYQMNLSHHRQIVQRAKPVTARTTPQLFELARGCAYRLKAPRFRHVRAAQ